MAMLIDGLSWLFLCAGSLVVLVGTLGLLRLPDVFCRMHGAGMTDTLGAFLILLGLAFQTQMDLVTVKLFLVFAFLMVTSPTATHALAQAAVADGYKPLVVRSDFDDGTGAPPLPSTDLIEGEEKA